VPERGAIVARRHALAVARADAGAAAVVPAGEGVEIDARACGQAAADAAVDGKALVGDAVEEEIGARRGVIAAVGVGGAEAEIPDAAVAGEAQGGAAVAGG